jgi:hypothetical protein
MFADMVGGVFLLFLLLEFAGEGQHIGRDGDVHILRL